jgi:hypothetical protein
MGQIVWIKETENKIILQKHYPVGYLGDKDPE